MLININIKNKNILKIKLILKLITKFRFIKSESIYRLSTFCE
jgi:hypothetical protein